MRSAFLLLALLLGVHTFHIKEKPNSKNHQDITKTAILRATAKVCESLDGFKKPEPLNTKTLAKSCKKDAFASNFETGIKMITYYNVQTDTDHPFSEKYHFDSESFLDGKALIIKGLEDITAYMKKKNFEDARKRLGQILHTLQDFYSHSNWIELGNKEPCTALINLEESIPNPADEKTETCDNDTPNTNTGAKIKDTILKDKILTSGYFGKSKKKGKCSHGGTLDLSTGIGRSWDGINKDAGDSSHGLLHLKAAEMAIAASMQLLEKIQTSNDDFFRLIGLYKDKPKGEWKTHFSLFSSKSRVSDASESSNEVIDV
ncbi:von Willebrand factor A domain-containing protein 7-like [Ctenopharyngodon idella]|uniref:von Willebrand factor A domain-containing protein 7-like n=1 Tax=Ctenopharyngodon idella TaxID=7959 RepID=UPI002230AEE1|nr:von Willebrand factor A domain-containing protein 7-like [Ctenopharyngodon idella]